MQNGIMIQYFHWYSPQGCLWKELKEKAAYLADLGVTSVWMPPAFKCNAGGYSVGYDVYDLYDLGEFDQKGSIPTKYGTKEEYLTAIRALHEHKIQAIADIVLNHKAGADECERVNAVKVSYDNRLQTVSDPYEIEAFTKFTFPGRKGKYSEFIWDFQCFTGVDFDNINKETAIFNLLTEYGHDWEPTISDEKGNYDYLMYADIETRNPAVRDELVRWAIWLQKETGIDGVRLDAVKHIAPDFFNDWLARVRQETHQEFFAVGEYWAPGRLDLLQAYLNAVGGNMTLFDSSLHHRLHAASNSGNTYDMRTIFDDTLVKVAPTFAVTVADNHDTQPLQALEAPIEPWFKPIAYALILLRFDGYPCLFYPDLFGAEYRDKGRDGNEYDIVLMKVDGIEELLKARKFHAYGLQRDYFDHGNCIGWIREGDEQHAGCAVVLSNGDAGDKTMEIGKRYAGMKFVDVLKKRDHQVVIDENGFGQFCCAPGTVSVWAPEQHVFSNIQTT